MGLLGSKQNLSLYQIGNAASISVFCECARFLFHDAY